MPNLYIIAGCNGAGKTTASYTVLPDILDCREFINADEIARGLSPFQPETVALEAGRIMLQRIDELMAQGHDFAFETTLASRGYLRTIRHAQELGYTVKLLYFWLQKPEMALERVKARVQSGGHRVPDETVLRRYKKGLQNFFNLYLPVCDAWMFIDNSEKPSILIAKGQPTLILDEARWRIASI
jgi:predicted ABC-type ATPase